MKDSSRFHLNCIKLHLKAYNVPVINCLDKQLFIINFATSYSDAFSFIKLNTEGFAAEDEYSNMSHMDVKQI